VLVPKEPEKTAGKPPADDDEGEAPATPHGESSHLGRSFSMRPSPPRGTKTKVGDEASGPSSKATPLGLGVVRPPMPTITDADELEEARQRSIGSNPEIRRVTPVGALSLANARAISATPASSDAKSPAASKPGATKKDSVTSLSAVDADWDELATTPPPPQQQALIDATALEAPKPPEVAPAGPPTEREMNDRVAVGDFSGALALAEQLLDLNPKDRAAQKCAESCRDTLKKMYLARIGPLDRVPAVSVARDQLRWLSIDHRAGFVLSLIDGVSTVEMILDVTGMPELDALRILSELVQQRIISFR
jgi:hypothetical protein